MQAVAVRWGFQADDVGLVTGNRRVNPDARVLVVVAEILLNRLLHPDAFDFSNVSAVVMDEFHSFADPERGIVWELSLAHAAAAHPPAAAVGDGRQRARVPQLARALPSAASCELVEGKERKVPLTYRWVPDEFLDEQLVADGQGRRRHAQDAGPGLLLQPRRVLERRRAAQGLAAAAPSIRRPPLHAEVDKLDWTQGVGPKLKQMLHRGVGVHHAGLLPKYRRVVEDLFERKLLAVVVCTETLAAGINLPARSVVLTSLVKGPPGKEKLIDASTAHQIFGRAGRPQFDDQGYVFALAHEDDVKILRWKEKYDQIPENTQGPGPAQGEEGLSKEEAERAARRSAYWSEGAVRAAARRAARQALQQGAAAVAAAGVPAEDVAGSVAGPHRDPQAADGRAAHRGAARSSSTACC